MPSKQKVGLQSAKVTSMAGTCPIVHEKLMSREKTIPPLAELLPKSSTVPEFHHVQTQRAGQEWMVTIAHGD